MISFKQHLAEAGELKPSRPPKWKKINDDESEIEFPKSKAKYKIEKYRPDGYKHKGEYKFYVWNANRKDWEDIDIFQGKEYVKHKCIVSGQFMHDRNGMADNSKQIYNFKPYLKFK